MATKMRIGEILLVQERIDPWVLTRTLKEQAGTRQRLVSMLISRALLDFDVGAMALSEQLGYPAAMQRHLERRDPKVAELVPPTLAARWVVLPIARARTGALIVCAREPTPILAAALAHAARTPVVLSVTPCIQIERLVRSVYGISGEPEEPLPEAPPSLADIGEIRLDDETTPPPLRRARTVSDVFLRNQPDLPPSRAPRPITLLDSTLHEIDKALTRGAADRLVMSYATKRWHASLLVKITNDMAAGVRGHGADSTSAESFSFSIKSPSIIQRAYDTRRATTERAIGRVQDLIAELLGSATAPAAAPVIAANRVEAVLAVGDPFDGEISGTLAELDRLVDALGAAYARFARDSR